MTLPPLPGDFEALAAEIEATVERTARSARQTLPGYSRAKARAIAGFTLMIGEAHLTGRIDDTQLRREMVELDRMVLRFVRTMTALANTLGEALVGAVSDLVRGALHRAIGPAAAILPDAPA